MATNEELVRKHQETHDPSIITELWKQNQGLIRMMVYKMVSQWDTEDALQEAALCMIASMNGYQEGSAAFSTYFYKALQRHLIQRFWKSEDEPEIVSLDYEAEDQDRPSLSETIPDKNTSADAEILDAESAAAILQAIRAELSDQDAEAVILRASGHTFEQIKNLCGYSTPGKAQRQLFKATRQLRRSQRFMDSLPSVYYSGGLQSFKHTWTSSTERCALDYRGY